MTLDNEILLALNDFLFVDLGRSLPVKVLLMIVYSCIRTTDLYYIPFVDIITKVPS